MLILYFMRNMTINFKVSRHTVFCVQKVATNIRNTVFCQRTSKTYCILSCEIWFYLRQDNTLSSKFFWQNTVCRDNALKYVQYLYILCFVMRFFHESGKWKRKLCQSGLLFQSDIFTAAALPRKGHRMSEMKKYSISTYCALSKDGSMDYHTFSNKG